ncbi:MAG: selenide, water dikinase SelD, partial [Pseudomonadota bacterium]
EWEQALARMKAGELPAQIAVLGAGVAGVELALAMADRLGREGVEHSKITLVDRGKALAQAPRRTRQTLLAQLERAQIDLREGASVKQILEEAVLLESGDRVPSRFTIAAAGAQPQAWLASTGLALHEGFVEIEPTLRSVTDPRIYAAGDCAHMSFAPRPKAGVFAVRQAPILAWNLAAEVTGRSRKRYRPQSNTLKLIKLTGQEALADSFGLTKSGPALWRWKDQIDRAFMRKLTDLPRPKAPPLPAYAARDSLALMTERPPLCGGCGAKVGPGALRAGLAGLPKASQAAVEQGIGDDAAVLRLGDHRQVLTTDHLRAAVLDPYLMGQLSVRHALGDVWAMGAAPQSLLVSVTLPPGSEKMQARMLDEVLSGAQKAASQTGAEIVGGHTSEGHELSISLTATGLAQGSIVRLSGACPGDVLVLTGPIGAGLLLAAEMQWRTKGTFIAPLWQEMARMPLAEAAWVPKAHAATDVTGFGLLGHARAMAHASSVHLEIDRTTLPLWEGALELAETGLRPSLFEANWQEVSDTQGLIATSPLDVLMCDPQTCGPFLLSMPEALAQDAVAQLGPPAARIGRVRSGQGVSVIGDP